MVEDRKSFWGQLGQLRLGKGLLKITHGREDVWYIASVEEKSSNVVYLLVNRDVDGVEMFEVGCPPSVYIGFLPASRLIS